MPTQATENARTRATPDKAEACHAWSGRLHGGADVPRKTLDAIREEAEREAIRSVMASHGFHVVPAARELNVSRVTLYRLMHKHNIRIDVQPGASPE